MWYEEIINNFTYSLENYGFIVIIILGILHPLTENPWSFFTMSLSIQLLGVFIGFSLLIFANAIGLLILYLIAITINHKSNDYLLKKNISKKVLLWIKTTPTWKHIIVIGLPLVPTYPIKVALPFSKMTFTKSFSTLLMSYVFLYSVYSLVYFGVVGILSDNIPRTFALIMLLIFAIIIYFGNHIKKHLIFHK